VQNTPLKERNSKTNQEIFDHLIVLVIVFKPLDQTNWLDEIWCHI